MVTNYPATIDTSQNIPIAINNVTPINATLINTLRSAIIAIEQALGVNPAGSWGTVVARISALENNVSGDAVKLGGDLGGTFTTPLVIGIYGNPVSNIAPINGQVLMWNGTSWAPGTNFESQNISTTGQITSGPILSTSLDTGLIELTGKLVVNGINTSTLSDAGQGIIYFDSTKNRLLMSENGGSYVSVQPYFNVKSYGAIGDGTTDDTAAIQATIAAAITAIDHVYGMYPATIYFPQGTYQCTQELDIPVQIHVKGDGWQHSTIRFTHPTNGVVWSAPVYSGNAGRFSDLALVCPDGPGIPPNITPGIGLTGLTVLNANAARVERCYFHNWSRQGVVFFDTLLCEFNQCVIDYSGAPASTVDGYDGFAALEVDMVTVGSNSFMWNNSNCGQNYNAVSGIRIDRTSVARIIGGTSEDGYICVQIDSKLTSAAGSDNIVIDGLDMENPVSPADCWVQIGFGTNNGALVTTPSGNVTKNVKIINCAMFPAAATLPYIIKCKNVNGIYIDGCFLDDVTSGPTPISAIWFDGNSCSNITIGTNQPNLSAYYPYVMINGSVVPEFSWAGTNWSSGHNTPTVFNVKAYGAKGDGSTNDAAAITAAITAAAVNGGTVYFPAGTYLSSAEQDFPPTVSLAGAGWKASIIRFTGATNGFVCAFGIGSPGNPYGGPGGSVSNISINGNVNSLDGLVFNNIEEPRITRTNIVAWGNRGIFLNNCLMSVMDQCLIGANGNTTYAQVEVDGQGFPAIGTTFNWNQCYISGSSSYASPTVAGLRVDRCGNCNIIGGAIESTGTPIQILGKTESNNYMPGVWIEGIDLENPNNGAEAYIEMGYGWTGEAGYGLRAPRIMGCTGYPSGSLTVAKPIKLKNVYAATISGNYMATSVVGAPGLTQWTAATVETLGNIVIPSTGNSTGYIYEVTALTPASDNKTGGNPAIFAGVTTIGNTVVDNHVTWTCVGQVPFSMIWMENCISSDVAEDVTVSLSRDINLPAVFMDGYQNFPSGRPGPVYNVVDFGALNPNYLDDTAAIQAAIDAAIRAGGGTIYFPLGTYRISSTLQLTKRNGKFATGIMLQGASMGVFPQPGYEASTLHWIGPSGGDHAILYINECTNGSITNLGFNGNGLADYCIWMQAKDTDTLFVNNINCSNLYYSSARKYNLLLGELDGSSYEGGNVSLINHTNCYFANNGVYTISHVRHNTYNGLKNAFYSCQFYGNGNGVAPYNACYISSGSAEFINCSPDSLGQVDFLMDDAPAVPPGDLLVVGWEGQSRALLWASSQNFNNRNTVFVNCMQNDIVNANTDGYYISWGVRGSPLVLDGCTFISQTIAKGNVVVSAPLATIVSQGTKFTGYSGVAVGVGFKGYVENVTGNYQDGYFNVYNLNTQNQMDSWGVCHQSNTSAVVTGSGATFSTIGSGEHFQLAINGLPPTTITFGVSSPSFATVINTINTHFQQVNPPNTYVCVPDPGGTQLRLAGTQSVQIIAGSTGTLTKLGLTAGTTNSAGPFPLAKLEGKQVQVLLDGYLALGNDELGGFMVIALQGSIAGFTVVGTFIIEGGAHSVTILSDINSFFTTTGGTGSKINIYWDTVTKQYLLQNNYGTSTFSCSLIGIGQH